MNITEKHALFYASKKSKLFAVDVCIHELINLQSENKVNSVKFNNNTQLIMVYNRCKRNNLSFKYELLKLCQSESMVLSRLNLFNKVYKKLLKRGN